ncbi:hypothetical protein D3C81_1788810 [compost metagenome]
MQNHAVNTQLLTLIVSEETHLFDSLCPWSMCDDGLSAIAPYVCRVARAEITLFCGFIHHGKKPLTK